MCIVQGNVGCIVDPELVLAQQTYSGMSLYYDSAPRLPPRCDQKRFSFGTSTYHQPLLNININININLPPPAPPPLWHLQPRTPRSINGFLSFWFFRWEISFPFSFDLFLRILSFNVLDANGLMQGSCFKNTKEITSLPSPNLLKTTKCHSFAPLDGSGAMFW